MVTSIMTSILIGTISLVILSLLTITLMLWIDPTAKSADININGLRHCLVLTLVNFICKC